MGQKNAELILEKLHLIRKLKFRNFIPYVTLFSGHSQSLIPHFRKFENDFIAKSFSIKQAFNKKIILQKIL